MKEIVDEEGLDQFITFGREVTSAIWNEAESVWNIKSKATGSQTSGEEVEEKFHYFVNGSGFLK